jgi:hypothetical protein
LNDCSLLTGFADGTLGRGMAYDLQARFRQLRTATSDNTVSTAPSSLPSRNNRCDELDKQLGVDEWDYGLPDNNSCDYLGSSAGTDNNTPAVAAHPLEGEYVASPPINVPIPYTENIDTRAHDKGGIPDSRYHEPSLLDEYLQRRRPSITFDSHVTYDDGERVKLEIPHPKLQIKTRARGRSLIKELADRPVRVPLERSHSESDRTGFDSETGEPSKPISARYRPIGREKKLTLNQPRYPLLQSTVDDLALNSPPPDFEASVSLTSQTTAPSPIHEEARTPPDGQMAMPLFSPLVYSPCFQPASYQESSAWPAKPRQFGSNSRAKSYTYERSNSLRRRSRRTSTTSMSPASSFLSRWSREESPAEPDDEGQEVGDYVLGKEIGFGGFSVVREACTLQGSERITRAVKIVRRQVVNRSEADNERLQTEFEHEVSLWRVLSHKHILPLIAVYITDFATFAFTQLNSGGTLFDLVRANRNGLRPDLARRYAYQLASAIRYLHEDVRVVHRDLKLENCLIDLSGPDAASKGGNLLLCDFGLADFFSTDSRSSSPPRPSHHPSHNPTRTIGPSETSTSIAGSLQYASPELILSPKVLLSTAVDMWAYGVVCYTLIVGDLPFQHTFQPRIQMMILGGEWDQQALKRGRGWGEGCEDLVAGCLKMGEKERWSIGRCLEGRWLGAYEEGEERGGWGQ